MTPNTTDLAAALNECMPLTQGKRTYLSAHGDSSLWLHCDNERFTKNDAEIIGILWAECVRRGWPVAFHVDPPEVVVWPYRGNGRNKVEGNDALAFARAFAAAKRAEGGAS